MIKLGEQTYQIEKDISIITGVSLVGRKEGEGPLAGYFDFIEKDDKMGEKTFEKGERQMFLKAISCAIRKSELKKDEIDLYVGGDLMNQLVSSNYTAEELEIPFLGLYNACATMTESLIIGSTFLESGGAKNVICATGSHFSTAERQYRYPLEFGNQRQSYAQWTVTGVGASVISSERRSKIKIKKFTIGKVTDFGICDIANMGAAMAPAAMETLNAFFKDTNTSQKDYDLIATGDLGKLGSDIFKDLMQEKGYDLETNYIDCGHMIYNIDQNTLQGGSGAGCSAVVLNSYILQKLQSKEFKNVLLISTGALMSTTVNQQGDSIPGIAHLVLLEAD
ncbi:MAG: stage V sporulation protein AD [Clostridia bacterium]|nr:stage V sporulation protein AD [Clostridia bacterium]